MSVTTRSAEGTACPDRDAILDEAVAEGWLPHTCFLNGPPGQVGIEIEHVLLPTSSPAHAAGLRTDLRADIQNRGPSSRITIEPGGQLELSGPPAAGVAAAVDAMAADLALLHEAAARHGLRAAGVGLDPHGPARRVVHLPRYDAMAAHFARTTSHLAREPALRPWPGRQAGLLMMCSTASVQVNVEAAHAGDRPDDVDRRWEVLHAAGPALVAAFANSPLHRGRPTGWVSSRQAVWWALDPARTHPPRRRPGESAAGAYARWALDVPLMLVPRQGLDWSAPPGVTFRDWLRHGERAVPGRAGATVDDLRQHLTTLFPPVRARGHLEIRYVDALPAPWWPVPVAVLSVLSGGDRVLHGQVLDACEPVRDRWLDAARLGVRDGALRRAALALLALAADRDPLGGLVSRFREHYTTRGRSPGDDLLEPTDRGTP